MGSDDDIAEERLLRVIEKGQQGHSSAPAAIKPGQRPFLSRIRLAFARAYARPVGGEDPVLTALQSASSLVWIVLAGAGLYLAYGLMTLEEDTRQKYAALSSEGIRFLKAVELPPIKIDETLRPEAEYLNAIQARNPFTGTSEAPQIVEEVRGPTPRERLQAMAQGLTVVGIGRGAVRDAIIEDSSLQRTHFVKAGDRLKEMIVKEIKHDSVVLSFEGEEIEIA